MAVVRREEPAHPVPRGGRRDLLRKPDAGAHRRIRRLVQGSQRLRESGLHPGSAACRRRVQGLDQDRRHDNFMTFGEFPGDERNLESRWFKPGVVFDRKLEALPFDPSKIEEHVRHSWYAGDAVHKPFQGVTEPKFTFMGDKDRYSWMKAPRYDGRAVETGPLAPGSGGLSQGQRRGRPGGRQRVADPQPDARRSVLHARQDRRARHRNRRHRQEDRRDVAGIQGKRGFRRQEDRRELRSAGPRAKARAS